MQCHVLLEKQTHTNTSIRCWPKKLQTFLAITHFGLAASNLDFRTSECLSSPRCFSSRTKQQLFSSEFVCVSGSNSLRAKLNVQQVMHLLNYTQTQTHLKCCATTSPIGDWFLDLATTTTTASVTTTTSATG